MTAFSGLAADGFSFFAYLIGGFDFLYLFGGLADGAGGVAYVY